MDRLVWTVTRDGAVAEVGEDGSLAGDPALCALLAERLRQPVTVYRSGTVAPHDPGDAQPILVRPGDGRHVVACMRMLGTTDPDVEITGCSWR